MTKRNEGIRARVEAFFLANPDEELTFAQLFVKFDANEYTARQIVEQLCRSGQLESVHVIRLRAKGVARE